MRKPNLGQSAEKNRVPMPLHNSRGQGVGHITNPVSTPREQPKAQGENPAGISRFEEGRGGQAEREVNQAKAHVPRYGTPSNPVSKTQLGHGPETSGSYGSSGVGAKPMSHSKQHSQHEADQGHHENSNLKHRETMQAQHALSSLEAAMEHGGSSYPDHMINPIGDTTPAEEPPVGPGQSPQSLPP